MLSALLYTPRLCVARIILEAPSFLIAIIFFNILLMLFLTSSFIVHYSLCNINRVFDEHYIFMAILRALFLFYQYIIRTSWFQEET